MSGVVRMEADRSCPARRDTCLWSISRVFLKVPGSDGAPRSRAKAEPWALELGAGASWVGGARLSLKSFAPGEGY